MLDAFLEATITAAFILGPLLLVGAVPTRIRRKVNAAFHKLGL